MLTYSQEDGVETAIQAIYRDLEYAKTLARQRSIASSTPFSPTRSGETAGAGQEEGDAADIEEWTLVEDDNDLDPYKHMREPTLAEIAQSSNAGAAGAGEPSSRY